MPFAKSPEPRAVEFGQERTGKLASEIATHLEVNEATVRRWKTQDNIDSGRRP